MSFAKRRAPQTMNISCTFACSCGAKSGARQTGADPEKNTRKNGFGPFGAGDANLRMEIGCLDMRKFGFRFGGPCVCFASGTRHQTLTAAFASSQMEAKQKKDERSVMARASMAPRADTRHAPHWVTTFQRRLQTNSKVLKKSKF